MSFAEVTLAVVLGLVVNEFSDVSPWLARRLVAWSARLRYGDTARAEIRAEELAAVINDRPGKLFKLGTGVRFASAALATRARRLVSREPGGSTDVLDDGVITMARRRRVTLDQEPSGGVAPYLFPTEKFRGEWRRHWIHPTKSVAATVLVATLAVWATVLRVKPRYAGWVLAGIVLVAVAVIALRLANWYLTRFVITNKRLMSTEGVLARRVAMMPLLRVTDMRYAQSILGRLLGYGTFTLESASRRNAMRRIVDLPNPNELYLRMVEEMYEPAAVEARLARWSEEDEDESWLEELPADAVFELAERAGTAPLPVPVPVPTQRAAPARDPADEHSEIVGRIGTLAGQLAALAASVAGIVPAPAPAPQPAPEVPPQSATQPALEPPPEPAPGPAQPGPAQPRQAPAPEST